MNTIQTIITYYKKTEKLSYRKFTKGLNTHIMQDAVSHPTVKNWVDGYYEPRLGLLLQVLRYAPDGSWQFRMAEQLVEHIEEKLEIN